MANQLRTRTGLTIILMAINWSIFHDFFFHDLRNIEFFFLSIKMWQIILCVIALIQLCLQVRKEFETYKRQIEMQTRREMNLRRREMNLHAANNNNEMWK